MSKPYNGMYNQSIHMSIQYLFTGILPLINKGTCCVMCYSVNYKLLLSENVYIMVNHMTSQPICQMQTHHIFMR